MTDSERSYLWRMYDLCTDMETRVQIHTLLRNPDAIDEVFKSTESKVAKVGDKIQGAGYCHDAPGGVVYAVSDNGFAHCVTIGGKDGGLAEDQYGVFGSVEFVPTMLEAYRNVVIEEMAKLVEPDTLTAKLLRLQKRVTKGMEREP